MLRTLPPSGSKEGAKERRLREALVKKRLLHLTPRPLEMTNLLLVPGDELRGLCDLMLESHQALLERRHACALRVPTFPTLPALEGRASDLGGVHVLFVGFWSLSSGTGHLCEATGD